MYRMYSTTYGLPKSTAEKISDPVTALQRSQSSHNRTNYPEWSDGNASGGAGECRWRSGRGSVVNRQTSRSHGRAQMIVADSEMVEASL